MAATRKTSRPKPTPSERKKRPLKPMEAREEHAVASGPHYALFVGRNMHYLGETLPFGQGVIPCAHVKPGSPIVVTYFQGPDGLGRPELGLRSVRMHTRVGGVDLTPVLVTAPAKDGRVTRVPTVIDLPADAHGELEYWFELETSGETLWDSAYGTNFRLPIADEPHLQAPPTEDAPSARA